MAVESRLERYRTVARLGSGGMASVVLAEDTVLGRQVALKRMHSAAADPHGLLRLHREALVGASMSHPNLVPIYDVIDSDDGIAVIVMEYVRGETLRDALSREGRLAPREALRVLRGVAAGLDAIHRRGIVHRDVKPANVLLGVEGSVKLADLGIASVPDHTRITTAGTVLGSFRYMAPEQLRDGPATRAIDIYALAAVAFEALAGRQARREPNALAVAHAIATRPPPDLREFWPEAPAAAAEALIHGMCRDPAGRPHSAGELVGRLGAALDPDDTVRMRVPVARRRLRRATAAHTSAGVVGQAAAARPRPRAGRAATRKAPGSRAAPAVAAGVPALESAAPARRVGSNGAHTAGLVDPSAPGAALMKTFRARPRVGLGRVVAPLAILLAAAGVVLLLLNSGHSSSSGGRASSTRATTTGAHPRSTAAVASTAHSRKAAGAATTTRAAGGAVSATSSGSAARTSGSSAGAPAIGSPGAVAATAVAGPRTSASSAGAAAMDTSTPAGAVQTFYKLAAAHRYSEAWALADPTFRSQLDGYASFQAGQAADRSITFGEARVTGQRSGVTTVEVQTTSVRTTGTEHCAGTVEVVSGGQSLQVARCGANAAAQVPSRRANVGYACSEQRWTRILLHPCCPDRVRERKNPANPCKRRRSSVGRALHS
jgi:eukaryotic-like serine/threonine-protein kinase